MNQPFVNLVPAMIHTLWQGALLAGLLWVFLRLLPARYVRCRYAAALLALGAIPFGGMMTWSVLDRGGQVGTIGLSMPGISATPNSVPPKTTALALPIPASGNPSFAPAGVPWTTWAGWLWVCGAGLMLVRAVAATMRAQRWPAQGRVLSDGPIAAAVADLARRMGIRRLVRVVIGDWTVPAVLGFVWPTLLLPAAILNDWPVAQLQMVLAHELAHVRRWDYLVNFWQQIVEAVLFFNPAVWWISRQVRHEREACCDACAVRITGAPVAAAQTLAGFAEKLATGGWPAGAALAVTGHRDGSLRDRIQRILRPNERPRVAVPWYAVTAALVSGLVILAVFRVGADVAVSAAQQFLSPAQVARIAAVQQAQDTLHEPSEMVELHGTVTTDDASAVPAGMCISILSHARAGNVGDMAVLDADGHFKHLVRSGEQSVVIHPDGYAPALIPPIKPDVNGLLPEIKCVLSRGFTARVRVIDAAGKPISGGAVNSLLISDFYRGERAGQTDSDGIAALEHMTAALPAQVDVTASGYEFERQTITFADGTTRAISMVPAKLTTGTVVDAATGAPLAGIVIRLVARMGFADTIIYCNSDGNPPRPLLATTDRDGRFTLDTLRSDCQYTLFASGTGHGSELFDGIHAGQQGLVWKLGPERVIHGRITGDLSRLETHKESNGQLTPDISCCTLQEVEHQGYLEELRLKVTIAEGVGTFEVRDPFPGAVSFTVADQHVRVDTAKIPPVVEIHLDDAAKIAAKAAVARRLVVFKFDVPKDAPPPQGKLDVQHYDPASGGYYTDLLPVKDGMVQYQSLAPGKIGYQAGELIGYWTADKQIIDVPAGDGPFEVLIPVIPAGAVQGHVLEPGGNVAANFSLSLVEIARSPAMGNQWGSRQPFNSQDNTGRFFVSPLPLGGRYRVVADSGNRMALSEEMTLDAQTPMRNVTLKFAAGVPLHVNVVDADGHPRSGINAYLLFEVQPHKNFCGVRQTTDRDGSLTFDHVNPDADGQYFLQIESSADNPGLDHFPVKVNGQPVAVKLPKVYTVKGQVLNDLTGKPLPHMKIIAQPTPGTRDPTPARAEAVTDDDGHFALTNLDQGEYRLFVENSVPAGAIIQGPPIGKFGYTINGDLAKRVHGGQTQEAIVRVIPRGD